MKTRKVIFVLFTGFLLLNACTGIKVVSDMDPTVDWSQYSTFEYYGWSDDSDEILSRFDKERIEKSFGSEFSKRGLEYVKENGDLIVTLFIVVEEKRGATAHTTGTGGYGGYYGYGPRYGWGGGYSTTTIEEYDFQEGTLVCDVFDAKNEVLIWEGIATRTVTEDPAKREKTIPKAVQALMSRFPVPPKQ
jgi:hypothetical protein